MALVSFFFNRPQPTQLIRTVEGQLAEPFRLDATVKEVFTGTAEPTQHPVEDGADPTDHIIIKPEGLSISGIVTKTPFEGLPGFVKAAGATVGAAIGSQLGRFAPGGSGAAGGVAGALTGAAVGSFATSIFGANGDRSLGAVTMELNKIRKAKQPIDIQTGLRLYKGFVLSSFTVTRDDKTGGAIRVDLELKELIKVESQFTTVAIPKRKGALTGKDGGRKTLEDPSKDETGKGSSLLKKFAGIISGH